MQRGYCVVHSGYMVGMYAGGMDFMLRQVSVVFTCSEAKKDWMPKGIQSF